MKLIQWPEKLRPREKLLHRGADSLSDAELLAIFLGTGTKGIDVVDLSGILLRKFGSLYGLLSADKTVFLKTNGLGQAKYAQLQAVLEMAKRYYSEVLEAQPVFDHVLTTRTFLMSQLRDEPNEVFAVILLDSQHRLITFKKVFYGTIDSAIVHPRVLVKLALEKNASAIILAHNHPSGIAEPSLADKSITTRIISALALIDVKVLDHVVIGAGASVSFAERGWV